MSRLPHPIASLLARHNTMIVDGAMSTELEALGADLNNSLWTAHVLLDSPDLVRQVHAAYWEAGAQAAITCTYQASEAGFAKQGIGREKAAGLITKAVAMADQARSDYLKAHTAAAREDLLICGSIGPYGAYLADGSEYTGKYDLPREAFEVFHDLRLETLAEDPRVDLLAFETHPRFDEIQAELDMISGKAITCWVTVTLAEDGLHMPDGTALADLGRFLDKQDQVEALGVNCVAREKVLPALNELHRVTGKPLILYPNSGECYDAHTKTWHGQGEHTHEWSQFVGPWYRAGARCLGGCCRTLPPDIAAIKKLLADEGYWH